MFLFLSKLLPVFVLPLGAALVLLPAAALLAMLKRNRLALILFFSGIGYLLFASLPITAGSLCAFVEGQVPPVAIPEVPQRDVIVVLGGILGQPLPPRTAPDLGNAADRILTAARLYRAGKGEYVLVAAGNLPWMNTAAPEAVLIRDLLVEWGVPASAIIFDSGSRNSYENAVNTKKLLTQHGLQNAILVTSALHMPRARAVFIKAGVDVFPVPTDYQVVTSSQKTILDYLPDAGSLQLMTMSIRELIGMQVYKWRGWIDEKV